MQGGRFAFDHNADIEKAAATTPIIDAPFPRLTPSPFSSSSSSSSLSTALNSSHSEKDKPRMRPAKINVLPRPGGTAYVPLENGGGPPGGGGGGRIGGKTGRRLGWRLVVLVLGVFVGAVWIAGPRNTYVRYTQGGSSYDDDLDNIDIPKNQQHPPFVPTHDEFNEAAPGSDKPPLTLPTSPHSPETDPDRLKTVHCISPHDPSKPLVQYALMLDAGSTGSRIHVYKFHNCQASPALEYEVFKSVIPGLSSYAGKPLEAAASLDDLMQEAVRVVPEKLQSCTKVAVKATAGLRLLGQETSEEILKAVRERLRTKYRFPLAGANAVAIMDGKDEGVYAWITANYLLGTIGGSSSHSSSSTKKTDTYAVLDLGGASTQIVFEPSFSTSSGSGRTSTHLEEGDHKYILDFGGQSHTLYQHSYLGYGLMRARRSVHNLVAFMWDFRLDGHATASTASTSDHVVPNPCLSRGSTRKVTLDGGKWVDGLNVTMVGEDVGSFESCNRVVELVMAKDALCNVKPCSFNGVYQPSILDTFPTGGILALSYFYDRISPLLPASSSHSKRAWGWSDPRKTDKKTTAALTPSSLPISEVAHIAQRVCAGPSSWEQHWGPTSEFAKSFIKPSSSSSEAERAVTKASSEAMLELKDRPEYCLDLTFMHALLRLGYEFGSERGVRVEKRVDGVELGWCLGATIAMLLEGGGLACIA